MTKRTAIVTLAIPLAMLLGWSQAEEEAKPILVQDRTLSPLLKEMAQPEAKPKEGWIGVAVRKPEEALAAHLVNIPKGVGFTVKDVEPLGPAALAGLRSYDYLWKLDDQLLINEGQFIALLALREIGDTVQLTYQRQGKDLVAEVILMERPRRANGQSTAARVVAMPPLPGLPKFMISEQERFAELEDAEGVVKVKRGSERFYWMAWNDEGERVGRGKLEFPDDRGRLKFPEEIDPVLKNKLSALIRAYEHAAGRGVSTTRMPRVRRVPVPKEDLRVEEE